MNNPEPTDAQTKQEEQDQQIAEALNVAIAQAVVALKELPVRMAEFEAEYKATEERVRNAHRPVARNGRRPSGRII